eukprot:CAMPEP_0197614434 /NCGR_PEP_ID=MMETSP1326-20131121/59514_1 /TAXON_ID=1155430 /ORGANISM="Genus nov. species nov., Strain RCC2288" /LENGTH=588 /DNA_ID=CAMNT_0043183307 /DNA_START=50 /DNA_END=1816 /DNA_ORIENTATION=+
MASSLAAPQFAGVAAPLKATARRNVAANATRRVAPAVVANSPSSNAVPYPKTNRPMKIIFVSTECAPWSKTGGLGDVVGSLPIELAKRGHKVMTISPRYDQYKGAWDTTVKVEAVGKQVGYFHEKKAGVDRVFVDHPLFLAKVWGKTGSKLYGNKSGSDFADNQERFAVFCHAALQAPLALPFGYGEDVVFVANDWHSGLVPVLLNSVYRPAGKFKSAKCVFTVHNIAFQGRFHPAPMGSLGLPDSVNKDFFMTDGQSKIFDEKSPQPEDGKSPFDGGKHAKSNWMKAAFIHADKSLTVSPNYAKEIAASASKGVELNSVINSTGGVEGICNGMDVEEWNPSTDKFLDIMYDQNTVVMGKAAAKQALQAEVGLPLNPNAAIFGYIGRLEEQKGCDIMMAAVPKLLAAVPNAQVVILGTGKKKMEMDLEKLDGMSPRVAGVAKFSNPIAHYITAGADFLLVPSRFEPCGLIQLHAMQYGTVPIVASTGGLVDTVKEGVTGFHMGAMDPDKLTAGDVDAMVETCAAAAAIAGTPKYKQMSATCIAQDLSWKKPAEKWEAVLEEVMFATSKAEKKSQIVTPKEKLEQGGRR